VCGHVMSSHGMNAGAEIDLSVEAQSFCSKEMFSASGRRARSGSRVNTNIWKPMEVDMRGKHTLLAFTALYDYICSS